MVLVLVNAASGTLAAPEERMRLHELLQAPGLDAEVVEVAGGREIDAALDRHSDDTVVAAGGDGTVSAVASRIAGTSRTLGVIPGGTLNHFAKDLKIPQELDAAVALLRARPTRRVIDAGHSAQIGARCLQ